MSSTCEIANNYEICKMMLMGRIEKQIEDKLLEGDNQVDIRLLGGFYKQHSIQFIKDVIIPELTTHHNGDSQYSCYKNGYYYAYHDCMTPYEIEYDGESCLLFTPVESDDEEESSDDEEESSDEEE
jgi:hypothetical protein